MSTASTAYVAPAMLEPEHPPAGIGRDYSRIGRPAAIAAMAGLLVWWAYSVDRDIAARYGPELLQGLWITAQLVVFSVLAGFALALPVTAGRLSKNPVIGAVAYGYSYLFRGTPLLAQIFLFYYGAGQFRAELEAVNLWWLARDPFTAALFVFTLNTAAYQSEILRGAVRSVSKGQWEGAAALGLRSRATFIKVVAPQAAITALRPLGNEIIFVIKGSAIASIITVLDLMGETRLAFSRTYDFTVYIAAALLYLVIVEVLRRLWGVLEKRLTRHLER